MTEQQRVEILINAKEFFKATIVENHINIACKKASKLSNYNINPFLYKYLAKFLTGNDEAESIAKALIYPRILGSSITTSFGMQVQKQITTLFPGFGSTTAGIDIEFIDAIDGRKKYCQLKAGPNTINKDDIKTVIDHFKGIKNLARTNGLAININDLIVGVIYGEPKDLSSHYKKISNDYPVIIGKEFWHRLTGEENFYFKLIDVFSDVAIEIDGTQVITNTIETLKNEIIEKGI